MNHAETYRDIWKKNWDFLQKVEELTLAFVDARYKKFIAWSDRF